MEINKENIAEWLKSLQDTICKALESEDGLAKFKEENWTREEGGGGRSRVIENGNVIEMKKRHPTLEDEVTIYAGATILGGRTILKKGTIIGGNAWVTSTTEEGAKIIFDNGNSQKVVKNE